MALHLHRKLALRLGASLVAITAVQFSAAAHAQGATAVPAGVDGAAPGQEPAEQDDKGLTDIVVTAQRREENLQDVPVTISHVSGAQMRAQGADTLKDIQQLVTGISIRENNDQRNVGFLIRGVGSNQSFIGIEPSAAINVDGEVQSRNSSLFGDINDLESIEVLKGPQGTLFGKNSVAGAMLVRTNRPKLGRREGRYDMNLEEGEGQLFGGVNASIMLNQPLSDSSALRLNAYGKKQQGWVPNVIKDGDNGGESSGYGGRVQYLKEFDGTSRLLARADYADLNFGPGIRVFLRRDDFVIGDAFGQIPQSVVDGLNLTPEQQANLLKTRLHELSNTPAGPNNNRTSASPGRDNGGQKSYGTSLEWSKDLANGYNLTTTLHARETDLYTNDSGIGVAVDIFPLNFAGTVDSTTFQHELRIASPIGETIDFVAGTYYQYSRVERDQRTLACQEPGLATSTVDANFNLLDCAGYAFGFDEVNPAVTGVGVQNGLSDLIYNREYRNNVITTHNAALFGQGNVHLHEKLTLVLGGRLTHENQNYKIDVRDDGVTNIDTRPTLLWINDPEGNRITIDGRRIFVRNPFFGQPTLDPAANLDIRSPATPFTTIGKSASDWAFSYKAALLFQPTRDLTFFANLSSGYKGAAWHSDSDITQARLDSKYPISPERSRNFELGARSEWFDRRLRVNFTYFKTDFHHYQERLRLLDYDLFPIVNGGLQNIANDPTASGQPINRFDIIDAGTLKTKGFDAEADWRVTNFLSLHGAWSHVDARFADTDVTIPCFGAATNCSDVINYGEFFDYTFPRRGRFFQLDGARLANAPVDTVVGDATVSFKVAGMPTFIRWNYRYRSAEFTNHGGEANNNENTTVPGVGIHNLFLGTSTADDRFTFGLSVKNLFSKHYYVLKTDYGDGLGSRAVGGDLAVVPELVGVAQAYPTYGATPDGRFFRQAAVQANVPRDFDRYVGLTFSAKF
ncbi:TonB-dependent receptor [Sphingomonas hylomeconis]|uniref:TonB-dependent receptor n=1 Tax=Sphingomonas hylomeconis TaxID=1395958 RepID=A0ABV7SY85_9SPHN|nr:TonB-dependent receptor [Sphingomonas hylomeconis]